MKRGNLYRVYKSGRSDPKRFRVFAIVSRQTIIDSKFSTVICAPIYSRYDGLSTQVPLGVEEGLKHESSIHCDELMSLPKTALTHFLGTLPAKKLSELERALQIALALEVEN